MYTLDVGACMGGQLLILPQLLFSLQGEGSYAGALGCGDGAELQWS